MLRMTHERQMRVQNKGQITLRPTGFAAHSSNLFEIHSAMELALIKTTMPSTKQMEGSTKSKACMDDVMRGTFNPMQTQINHAKAHQRNGDEANQHQGSAVGRVHVNQVFSGGGGLSVGSCGCAPTSPMYSVSRVNFKSAARASVLSAETATAGKSYFPSGSAKR